MDEEPETQLDYLTQAPLVDRDLRKANPPKYTWLVNLGCITPKCECFSFTILWYYEWA